MKELFILRAALTEFTMEESFIELIEGPELTLNITEYNTEFTILNDRSDKSSSGVWKHFGAIKHGDAVDKKHVYCTHCFFNRRIKKYQRSTSTGNLSKHLRKQHNISLNQTFRVKKEADNSIHLIKKETESEVDKGWYYCFIYQVQKSFIFKLNLIFSSLLFVDADNFDEEGNDEYLVHGKLLEK